MALEFSLDSTADPVIVRLTGALTLGPQLGRFARSIATLLTSRHVSGVLLDVRGIDEIDSAGLGELVILYTASGEAGSRLCLVCPKARVLKLLETTRLSGLIPQFSDEESACRWLRGTPIVPGAPG